MGREVVVEQNVGIQGGQRGNCGGLPPDKSRLGSAYVKEFIEGIGDSYLGCASDGLDSRQVVIFRKLFEEDIWITCVRDDRDRARERDQSPNLFP